MKKYTKIICMVAAVCLLGTAAFCGFRIYSHYAHESEQEEVFEKIAEVVEQAQTGESETDDVLLTEEETVLTEYGELYLQNTDMVDWLLIAGTNINYPVMQTPNNPNYYLKHSFEKEYSDLGTPYVQENCDLLTSDTTRLDEIQSSTTYDVLEMSGSRAVWKEVLAVYSVKTTTDPDNPQEVATMDENKKQLLSGIFWEMNEISSHTESKTETAITESDDGHGNIVQTETTVTRTYLYITVSHKTADEMADLYAFNEEQRQQLSELLAEENNSLWSAVLYGISIGDGEIVTVALSQVGNVGGQPYWSWYGFDGRVEWCACFVSWCANECGYIDSGVIPKFAGCANGVQWFKDRGQWQDNSFEPSAGQIIFFDWEGDGETDHVGIVERCENGIVYTVEGNSGDACRQKQYAIGSSVIYGYGIPAY